MNPQPKVSTAFFEIIFRRLAGGLSVLVMAGSAHADLTLVEDTFTAGNGTTLEGRTPAPTDLPGGNWARANTYWASSVQDNTFRMGPDNGWTVPLASFGSYARPSKLRLSADLKVNNMDNGSGNGGGVGLGFNLIAGGGSNPHGSVTALRLDRLGKLSFRRGEGGGLGDLASVPWSGPAFDPFQFYHLSYEVDSFNGTISNIQVTGGAGDSTSDYSSLSTAAAGYFKGSLVTYAYIWGNSGSGGSTGFLDNFKVERVGNALPPKITVTAPAAITPGAALVASASVLDGDGPSTVQFYLRALPGGAFSAAGSPISSPPYQVNAGTLPLGSYEIYATATDASTTVPSATHAVSVQAATGLICVDFNTSVGPTPTFSGAAATGSSGDVWNGLEFPNEWTINYNAYSFSSIVDSQGAVLGGVSVDLAAGHIQCFNPWGSNANGSGFNNLTQDYIAYDPRFTVNGLAPGNYEFYLYGTRGTYAPVSVNGGTTKSFNGGSGSNTPTLLEGRDYLKFPVVVGMDGKLEFHATSLGGDGWAYRISGFQIQVVIGGGGSPYDDWALAKGLTSGNNQAEDDADFDGVENLAEFAFNGNPSSGSDNGRIFVLAEDSDYAGDPSAAKELILTMAVRAGTPVFGGSPPSAAVDGITYSVEGGTTLSAFPGTVNVVPTPVITGLPAAGSGYEYRSFSLGGSDGLSGKGFLRAKVTQP